jgi:capsular polysaccharide biosynthesis protein
MKGAQPPHGQPPLISALALVESGQAAAFAPTHLGYGYRRRPVTLLEAQAPVTAFYLRREAEVGWQGLIQLKGAVLMPSGVIVTAQGQVLSDSLAQRQGFSPDAPWLATARRQLTLAAEPGSAAVVLSQGGAGNYGHWLADALPRLRLLPGSPAQGLPVLAQGSNLGLAQMTQHLLPPTVPALSAWPRTPLRLDALWFPASCNCGPLHHCQQGLEWVRQAAWQAHPTHGSGRRLFVSRDDSSTRQLLNDADEIWPLFAAQGFERIRCGGLSFEQQVRLFAQASVVAGIAGAALANLIFCRPDTQVLMLTPDNLPYAYYWDVVQHLDRQPVWLFGPAADPSLHNRTHFRVDATRVRHWLASLP